MFDHISDAIAPPQLVSVSDNMSCLRFETMKLYSAVTAVDHLLSTGHIDKGDTLIDSSSGIYALALAMACHKYGMNCHIVGSTTIDHTMRVQLEILGATVEQVPPSDNLKLDQNLRVQRIQEIMASNPSYHWMQQYHDDIHYLGYKAVADLLDRELPSEPFTLVGGVGTGVSTGAISRYLRSSSRDLHLVGIQPFGSVTFNAAHVCDPGMIIAGIGSSIEFHNVTPAAYDRLHWVSFTQASRSTIQLMRDTGIFAGLSSGAAYLTADWERCREPNRHVVFIAADTGHRYVTDVYSRHREVDDLAPATPFEIHSMTELKLPWSTMDLSGFNHSTQTVASCVPPPRTDCSTTSTNQNSLRSSRRSSRPANVTSRSPHEHT